MPRKLTRSSTLKAWDTIAAWDLQAAAEELLRKLEPEGYERSEVAASEGDRLREELSLSYYWQDAALHERVLLQIVLCSLGDYARWLDGSQEPETKNSEPGRCHTSGALRGQKNRGKRSG